MKTFTFLTILLLISASAYSQETIINSTQSKGFGRIGVVASSTNYQSGHFENPALLGRNPHKFDLFGTYEQVRSFPRNFVLTGGLMVKINPKHTLGIGIHYNKNDIHKDLLIPINYAYNIIKKEKFGITIGCGTTISNHDVDLGRYTFIDQLNPAFDTLPPSSSTYIIAGNYNRISTNLGIDIYKTFYSREKHSFRLNGAMSVKTDFIMSSYDLWAKYNIVKLGTIFSWKYNISTSNSFNLNLGYQLTKYLPISSYPLNINHFGLEGKYIHETSDFAIAIRCGKTSDKYDTYGASIYFKGFYLDFAIVESFLNQNFYSYNGSLDFSLGYQLAF
jgi:hypothetical protein